MVAWLPVAYLEGIDVSAYQRTTPILHGEAFIWVKASEGTGLDPMYVQHVNAALSHGIDPMAYHFGRAGARVADQVATFLLQTQRAKVLALDVERSPSARTVMTEAQGREFISTLRARDPLHRQIALYGSLESPWPTWPHDNWGADIAWKAWPASTPPPEPYAFWQYSQTGLDRDRFNGDTTALNALLGRPPSDAGVVAMLNRSGYPRNLSVKKGDSFYAKAGDTKPIGHMSTDAVVAVQGRVVDPGGGWYEVWLTSSAGYPDDQDRPSAYYLHLQEPVTWAP